MLKLVALISFVSALAIPMLAQTCNNDLVLFAVSSGGSESEIARNIEKAPSCAFDLRPSTVAALKAKGVSETIIAAMDKKMEGGQPQDEQARPSGLSSDEVVLVASDGRHPLLPERIIPMQGKIGVGNAILSTYTFGKKGKSDFNSIVKGENSPTQVPAGSLSVVLKGQVAYLSSQLEFLRLDVKNGNRIISTQKGSVTGFSDEKSTHVAFTASKQPDGSIE